MEERKSFKIKKDKNQVDLFDQMSKNFTDMYEGKGSFMEYAKSKEEEVTKIKDDIFSLIYGPGYKENLDAKKNNKKSPKSNFFPNHRCFFQIKNSIKLSSFPSFQNKN